MVTRGRFLASLVVLATILSAPGIASAATVGIHSDEVGPNTPTGATTREAVTALQNDWRADVVAAGGIVEEPVRFLAADHTLGQSISGIVHTAADGTTLAIHRTRYTTDAAPVFAGNSTSLGTLQCTGGSSEGGQVMQGDAPRPDVLTDGIGCTGTGGFYYNVISGTGEGTTRDAIEFTFGRPVLGFGSWFGDLESRVTGGGVAALMRLYDESGTLLSETTITPTATTCSNATVGCGNDTTRWLGFVADPTEPVSRMVVIVGDEDVTGTAAAEGLSIIGPTFAMFPEIGLAKRITGVTDNLDGTQTVGYEFVVENTGDVALTTVSLVDDLTATFGSGLTAVGAVSVDPASGLTANSAFDGVTDTTLAIGTLAIGATALVSVSATVLPDSAGPFVNSATVTATAPRGDVVSDTSQDGTDADADGDGDPGTDSAATPVTFALTGSVEIEVAYTGVPAEGLTGAAEIVISCPATADVAATVPVTASGTGSAVVRGIPVGAACTVTEVGRPLPPSGFLWDESSEVPPQVTLTRSGEQAGVLVGGTLRRLQGDLAISAAIVGAPFGGITGDIEYSIDCGAEFDSSRVVAMDNDTSGAAVVNGLAAGTECEVSVQSLPTAPPFFAWADGSRPVIVVTIVDGETAMVAMSHTLRAMTGSAIVTLSQSSADGSGISGERTIELDCGPAGIHSLVLDSEGTGPATGRVDGIPAPSQCGVSMTARPLAPVFSRWSDAPIDAIDITDGGTSVVEVVDRLVAVTGSAQLSVSVADGPALTGTLIVRLSCGPAGEFTRSVIFSSSPSATLALPGIPAPSECLVQVVDRPPAPAGYSWFGAAPTTTLVVGADSTVTSPLVLRLQALAVAGPSTEPGTSGSTGGSSPRGATPSSSPEGASPAVPGATPTSLEAPTLAVTSNPSAGDPRNHGFVPRPGDGVGAMMLMILWILIGLLALIALGWATTRLVVRWHEEADTDPVVARVSAAPDARDTVWDWSLSPKPVPGQLYD